ncbi:MAG: hypothetical protein ACRCYP_04885 [Alphaproteobacteria bacterium]
MKKIFIVIFSLILSSSLVGCASLGNSLSKTGTSISGADYRVTLYSGGQPIRQWDLHGIVSEEAGSDGWYFNCKRQVIRISGDVVVEPPSEVQPLPSLIKCSSGSDE